MIIAFIEEPLYNSLYIIPETVILLRKKMPTSCVVVCCTSKGFGVTFYLDKNSQAVKKRCGPVQNGQYKKKL